MERILKYNWKIASEDTVRRLNDSDILGIPPFGFEKTDFKVAMRIADICYVLWGIVVISVLIYSIFFKHTYSSISILLIIIFAIITAVYLSNRKNYGKEFLEKAKNGDFKELDVDAIGYYNGFSYGPQTRNIFTHVWTIFHDDNSIFPDDYGCWLMYRGDIFGKTKKALLFEHEDKGEKIYEIIILLY